MAIFFFNTWENGAVHCKTAIEAVSEVVCFEFQNMFPFHFTLWPVLQNRMHSLPCLEMKLHTMPKYFYFWICLAEGGDAADVFSSPYKSLLYVLLLKVK